MINDAIFLVIYMIKDLKTKDYLDPSSFDGLGSIVWLSV
jgi:hypothetical protein